jgi:hypothetical protein
MEQNILEVTKNGIKYTSVVTEISGTVTKMLTHRDIKTNKVLKVQSESVLTESFYSGHLWKYQIPNN